MRKTNIHYMGSFIVFVSFLSLHNERSELWSSRNETKSMNEPILRLDSATYASTSTYGTRVFANAFPKLTETLESAFSYLLENLGLIHTGRASKWDLLMWMGVSTLHASNIKGFAFEFVGAGPVWMRPKGSGKCRVKKPLLDTEKQHHRNH